MNYTNDINEFGNILKGLSIYKNIKDNPVMNALCRCLEQEGDFGPLLFRRLLEMAEKEGYSGNIYKKAVIQAVLDDENLFAVSCEKNCVEKSHTIYALAAMELEAINSILELDLTVFFGEEKSRLIQNYKPIHEKINNAYPYNDCMPDHVAGYYKAMGCGVFSRYPIFKVIDGEPVPVEHPDQCVFDEIIGYDIQKKALRDNTEAFLKGYPAANVLLAGARGTGKSTCVKALADAYFKEGLRIIDISKDQLRQVPALLQKLGRRGKYFILFVDDLSFEDFEIEYKYLKSLLEGGAQAKPGNVLFYATSNRRHIILEKWSDKNTSNEDELHTSDTINEKLSLSDRFGLTITFGKPSPKEYMAIVAGIAHKEKIDLAEGELKKLALSYELNNKGLSGRTAKQFVDSLIRETNV